MVEIAICAEEMGKSFGDFVAVQNISLTVAEGNLMALLGPNGAGKTTTVRMLASILRPSHGHATIAGFDSIDDAEQVRARVGLLTEQPGLYGRMNAVDYLDFFGALQKVDKPVRHKRARALLERFGLWEYRNRPIGTFSKGMRQKVSLCRAVIHDPQIVFLDEPTSALDPSGAKAVRDYIVELKARGRTIIVCSHNLSEVEALADHIAIIKHGRIVAEGSVEELKRRLLGPPLYELHLATPLPDGWAVFDGFVPTEAASPLAIATTGASWIRYATETPEQTNPLLLRTLIAQGAAIVSLAEVPRSLESVYLSIVDEGAI